MLAQEDLQEEGERRKQQSKREIRKKDGKWRGGIRQDGDRGWEERRAGGVRDFTSTT